ncbi:MAG: phosphoglycolate phosphatase [Verrucomicrobia bacterium]|nr:phosphoglycolate phosphatase [Verrucomicrobiota bacterium]
MTKPVQSEVDLSGSFRGFDAVLFDLDGTLIDSAADIAAAVNHVRSEMGLTRLPSDLVRSYVGDGVRSLMERALQTTDAAIMDRAISLWRPHYAAHCLDQTRLYPGVQDVLEKLALMRLPLGIVSNKPAAPSEAILRGLGVREAFLAVVGGDTTPKRKPDPEPLRYAAAQMRIESNRVLVVGDSPNDILGARNAGYTSCGVLWGLGSEAAVREAQPDHLVRHPDEIPQIIIAAGNSRSRPRVVSPPMGGS